jgi:hypothetical protein
VRLRYQELQNKITQFKEVMIYASSTPCLKTWHVLDINFTFSICKIFAGLTNEIFLRYGLHLRLTQVPFFTGIRSGSHLTYSVKGTTWKHEGTVMWVFEAK